MLAAGIRLERIKFPGTLVFDEYYYVPEASELIRHGVEWNDKTGVADFVAHPPLGKWCIAAGVALFGNNPLGWRVPAIVAGVISVIIITRLALRMFGSMTLGVIAGLLMAADGLHFVLSRTGILDIFLMTFVLAAFAFLVRYRERLQKRWLIAAGGFSGLAIGVKWSAVWFLLAFAGLAFAWSYLARRAFWRETVSLLVLGAAAAGAYLTSWSGWFATDNGLRRHWLGSHGIIEPPVLGDLVNLLRNHLDVLIFHIGLDAPHQYQSQPWQWLVMGRPVLFWWTNDGPCGAARCDSEILLLGTPLLWWTFPFALIALTWLSARHRDWRGWAILTGVAAGILPWLPLPDRTKYLFYILPSEPFLILAIVLVLSFVIGQPSVTSERRFNRLVLSCGYVAAVLLCFAYFYPLYTAVTLTHEQWWARLWWVGHHWI